MSTFAASNLIAQAEPGSQDFINVPTLTAIGLAIVTILLIGVAAGAAMNLFGKEIRATKVLLKVAGALGVLMIVAIALLPVAVATGFGRKALCSVTQAISCA